MSRAAELKEVRKEARKVGLIFRRSNTPLDGVYLWYFQDSRRGDFALKNCLFWEAYSLTKSGFIRSFDAETGYFRDEMFFIRGKGW